MTVSNEEKNNMKDVLAKLQAIESGNVVEGSSGPTSGSVGNKETEHMKEILERFYQATESTTQRLVEESVEDEEVRDVFVTRKEDNRVVHGMYEINVRVDESSKKPRHYYDVSHTASNAVLFKDLVLYEAAHLIVKYLNKGYPINSPEVKHVIDLEEKYSRNRIDAARYKARAKKCLAEGNREKAEILKHRFDRARDIALEAKEAISDLRERL